MSLKIFGSFLFGVSLWAAAWAPFLDLFNVPLQPAEITILVFFPFLMFGLKHLNFAAFCFFSGLLLSTALAQPQDDMLMLLWAWQMILPPLFCIVCALLMQEPSNMRGMISGFIIAGAFSAVLAICQVITLNPIFDWRNNVLFSLPPQFARGFALLPEASTLAVHLTLALTLAVIFEYPKPRKARWAICFILGASLIWTASSSIFIIGPVALFLIWRILPDHENFWPVLLFALGIALISWGVSIEERAAANANTRSAAIRLSTMIAGLTPVLEGQVLGHGIGSQSLITQEALSVARQMGLRFGTMPQGINSFVISQIYEQGSLVFLLYIIGAVVHIRALFARNEVQKIAALGILCAAIAAFVVGYRGIYLNWIPFATSMALLARQSPRTFRQALSYVR